MSKQVFERLFGPDWRKHIDQVRWEARNSVSDRNKRNNTRPAGKGHK